jgi:DNA primase
LTPLYYKSNDSVCLCEGEFDALTLHSVGLNAVAAGGKNFNLKQANALKNYNITICLDNDKAGIEGGCNMFKLLLQISNNKKIKFITPPKGYKDYNDMLVGEGPNILKHYIANNQKFFDINSPLCTIEDYLKVKLL